MEGIDPINVKAGDVIMRAWDEDPGGDSCHCAFRVEVGVNGTVGGGASRVVVIAHALKKGDVVWEAFSRGDEGACHCDKYFLIDRVY